MQRQTLLVSAAVFALLAIVVWFIAAREPAPKAHGPMAGAVRASAPRANAAPPAAAPQAAPPSLPAGVRSAQTPAPTPPVHDTAAAAPQAATASELRVDTPPDALPGDGAAGAANADAASTDPAAKPDAAAPSGTSPPDKAGAAGTEPPPAENVRNATPGAPRDDRAADLFAARIAALEDAGTGGDTADAPAVAAQQAYEARAEGGAAAKAAQALVHDVFADWLAGLAPDIGHPSLVAVDCRSGACRVLIAQGGIDFGGAAQLERASPVNAFERALTELRQGSAWRSAGFELLDRQMHAAAGSVGKADDIALWTIYLDVRDADAAG